MNLAASVRHCDAARAWLRVRLERLLASRTPVPGDSPSEPALEDSLAALRAAEAEHPRAVLLAAALGLSRFELELLLLCAAVQWDPAIAALVAAVHGAAELRAPTFGLAFALLDDPAWDSLAPDRPLRRWRLVECPAGPGPLVATPLRGDERIVNFLLGIDHLDARLAPFVAPLPALEDPLPPSQEQAAHALATIVARAGQAHLLGRDAACARRLVARAAALLELAAHRLPLAALPPSAADQDELATLWDREARLTPLLLHLDTRDAERPGHELPQAALVRLSHRLRAPLVIDARERIDGLADAGLVDAAHPTQDEQRAAWTAVGLDPAAAATLVAQFDLDAGAIARVAASVPGDIPDPAACWQACLRHTRPALDALAQRIDVRADWHDLVLPPAEEALLRAIVDQVRLRARVYDDWGFRRRMNRGLGIVALFSGESGTGKTMAAEVVARATDLSLYRIDLAAVVSKYIGETEKNLRRLFDAAEDGGAVLFFDEADALFGKRSEVKDAHDRYANIEVGYLLQRLEAYRGLAILATNLKSAVDAAFVRRLRFVVQFPFPGPAEREALWRRVFPPEAAQTGLDHARLARLSLTGGSIHNIALHAAFLAAGESRPIDMPAVLSATRAELKKLGRPTHEADLR